MTSTQDRPRPDVRDVGAPRSTGGSASLPDPTQSPPEATQWPRRWHYRRSLASRVILLTTVAVGLAVAILAAAVYVIVRAQLMSSLDESLLSRAQQSAASPVSVKVNRNTEVPGFVLGAVDVRIAFARADGFVVRTDRMKDFPDLGAPELAVASGARADSVRTVRAGGTNYRVVAVPFAPPSANELGTSLVIAQSMEPNERVLHKLGIVLPILGLIGMLAAALAGWGVARNGLRPVRNLTSSVEDIARTEDLTSLKVEGDDEIARLATAFNQMLTALAASRDRQRQLVADAGHELRTPLTSLRTNLDLLAQADGPQGGGVLPPQARAELLDDVRAQIEELTTLIGDLVELARDQPSEHVVEAVELHEVLDHAVARVRRRAPGVTFEVDSHPWWVVGDCSGLERALTNLLDNAAKWSPSAATVHVSLDQGVLIVDDEGPGIAEEDLPLVFDRFYRSMESRSMPGSGLGLSIVRQVAERHSGTVEAGRAPCGGAQLVLRLPGSPAHLAQEAYAGAES